MRTQLCSRVRYTTWVVLLVLQLGAPAAHAAGATTAADSTAAPPAAANSAAPAGAAGTTAAPNPPAPADTAQNGPASGSKDELQTVVVYGMTANLEKSLELKRLAPVVMDSINSTELGRFPDNDVADSLSHLPGITIDRTTGGEGQKITVRGLTSEYNIVTLNNRILASDDDGRDLAFDVLPAELITGADVLKSPQA